MTLADYQAFKRDERLREFWYDRIRRFGALPPSRG